MSNDTTWTAVWGTDKGTALCSSCDGVFLLPADSLSLRCPFCGQAELDEIDPIADQPAHTQPPELLLPFAVVESKLKEGLARFIRKTWLAPADLTPANLSARLQRLYLPIWLVDVKVKAQWQGEVGFNYQVVSHRDQYQGGQWKSQEVRETKIRWQARLGTLQRQYENQPAPALAEQHQLERILGKYKLDASQNYDANEVANMPIHLPNRPPQDAWPEAEAGFKKLAMAECREAAVAEHFREFRWAAKFKGQNWTQLLFPIYTTYYYDDEGQAHMIYAHGQRGIIKGGQRASPKKARGYSLTIGAVALLMFALTLILGVIGIWESGLLPLALAGMLLAVAIAVLATLPMLIAWYINKFGTFFNAPQEPFDDLAKMMKQD